MSLELEEYSKFIQQSQQLCRTSKLLESHYGRHGSYRDEKIMQAIDSWVRTQVQAAENRPMLVDGAPLSGRKTMLVQWAAHHREFNVRQQGMQNDDLVLMEFAANGNGKYSETIYCILSSLRVLAITIQELLMINQKVETNEEKLRRFFPYWMEVCSKALHKKRLDEGKSRSKKIIIVVSDIDTFTNDKGQPLLPGFWMPETFPEDVRVLVSAKNGSLAALALKHSKSIRLSDKRTSDIKYSLIANSPQPLQKILNQNYSKVSLQQCRMLLQLFSQENPFCQSLKEFDFNSLTNLTVEQLCVSFIEFWQGRLLARRTIEETFKLLALSKKGLTAGEVCCIAGLRPSEFKKFVCVFEGFVESYEGIWFVPDRQVRSCLLAIMKMDTTQIAQYHLQIAKGLRQLPHSLRKLEEETYHLFEGGGLPELKQTVSQVENFLLLFNWHTKYELCHYWKQLELKHSFDPVFEYNRSLTTFEMHSYPSEENLFRLLLQFSRFFIEYAHFEMYNTPSFRHPLIKGDEEQLSELHVLEEFKTMGMLMERQVKYLADKTKRQSTEEMARSSHPTKNITDATKQNSALIQSRIHQIVQDLTNKKPIRLRETKPEKADRYVYLNEPREWIETISLDIPNNRLRFQQHYLRQLEDYFKQAHLQLTSSTENPKTEASEHYPRDPLGAKLSLMNDSYLPFSQFEEEKYHLSFQQPKNYYYKQWLWIQFPWISMSLNCDYSRLIRKCIQSSTQYIDVSEEKQLTTKAIIMSMETNKRKCMALNKGAIGFQRIPIRESKPLKIAKNFPDNKNIGRQQTQGSKMPERRLLMDENCLQLNRELKKYKASKRNHAASQDARGPTAQNTFLTGVHNETEIRQPLPTLRTQRGSKSSATDTLDLKRSFNAISYENSRMQKKILELQMLSAAFEQGDSQKEEEQLNQQLKRIIKKGDELRLTLAKTLVHQQKLRTIIDICHENKICNAEAVGPLNNFVSSLKAMIECAKIDNKKFKQASRNAEKELKHQLQTLTEELSGLESRNPICLAPVVSPDNISQADGTHQKGTTADEINREMQASRFDKAISYKQPVKSSLMLTVEEFEARYGELSLANPKILQLSEAIEKRNRQEKRMIELELERDTLLKKIADVDEQATKYWSADGPEDNPDEGEGSLDQELCDLHDQLESTRQKKAGLQIFLSSVESRMRLPCHSEAIHA